MSFKIRRAALERHLDACDRCRNNPFGMCRVGVTLLESAASASPFKRWHRPQHAK